MKKSSFPARTLVFLVVFINGIFGVRCGNAASPAPGTEESVPWAVVPNPAAEPASIKPDISLTQSFQGRRDLLVPNRPGPCVMSLDRYSGGWEVWNLHDGTKVRSGTGTLKLNDPVLSPDGKYIAGTRAAAAAEPAAIEVWSLEAMKRIGQVPGTSKASDLAAIGFTGTGQVIVHDSSNGGSNTLRIHDVKTGQASAEIAASLFGNLRLNLTPGGSYAILPGQGFLTFYSTSTGKAAGRLLIEPVKVNRSELTATSMAAMGFSTDGKEAAILLGTFPSAAIITFDLTTGAKKEEIIFDTDGVHPMQSLEYFPDASAWLVWGETIVSRAVKAPVYSLPRSRDPYLLFSRMAGTQQVVRVSKELNKISFVITALPKDLLAKAASAVAAGGNVEDAELPPIIRVDCNVGTATVIEAPTTASWAVPVPAITPTHALKAFIPLRREAQADKAISRKEDEATVLAFTSRAGNAAIVEHVATDHSERGGHLHRTGGWIERYDLATGTMQAQVETPATMELLDASPTGNTIVLRSGKARDRIDLMSQANSAYKPLVAFRPYSSEAVDAISPAALNAQAVEWAALLDDTHVLTAGHSGMIALWELPTGKLIWHTSSMAPAKRDQAHLALWPDRKLAAYSTREFLSIFDPLTGKPVNTLALPKGSHAVGIAISPDAKLLTAIIASSGGPQLVAFDLSSGKQVAAIPLPETEPLDNSVLQFPSPGFVLVGTMLVSLEKQGPVACYSPRRSGFGTRLRFGPTVPFDSAWFVVPPDRQVPNTLVRVSLPDEAAKTALANLKSDDLYDWHPGMSVAVKLTVVGSDDFHKQELQRWTDSLKAAGFNVVDDSPNVLTANNVLVAGKPAEYELMPGNQKVTITPQSPGWNFHLSVGGKEVWKSENPGFSTAPPLVTVWLKNGESAQAAIDRQYQPPKQASTVILPPSYIFKARELPQIAITSPDHGVNTGVGPRPDRPGTNRPPRRPRPVQP